MMSRVNRRSSPSPRWRTSSGTTGHKTPQASQILFQRDSFKRTGSSDLPPDNYVPRRFPVPSHGLGFPTDMTRRRSSFPSATSSPPRVFRSERHPSPSLKNQKRIETSGFSKAYFKPLRDNVTRPISPSKFQAFLKNNKSKQYFHGMKRPSDLKDFMDFPPAKQQKRNMEDIRLQSRPSQLSGSNVLWCAPPFCQRTRSTERKSDSVSRGSHSEKPCPDRVSTISQRQAHINLKTPCQADDGHDRLNSKDSRGQHAPPWRQFPSEERSGNMKINHSWSEVQRSSPRSHKKSGEGTIHHQERRNSFELRKNIQHSNCSGQSPKLHYRLENRNGISSMHNNRFQRGKSSTFNNGQLQDDDRCQGTSFSNERDAVHKSKPRESQRQHRSYERKPRDNIHKESRSSSRSKRSSSTESFCEVEHSWSNIVPQERSRSQSSSSVKRRRQPSVNKKDAPSDQSEDGARSVGSPFSSADVKAKVPEFNPDYVVIIRRANEGARPLCKRDEFSGKPSTPVNNDGQLPVDAKNVNIADSSSSALTVQINKRETDDSSNSELSSALKESSVKLSQAMYKVEEKVEEKAGDVTNTKPVTATFNKSSRALTEMRSMLTKKDVAGERFARASPDYVGEQRCQEKTDHASKSTEEEVSFTSSKRAFDLRQKIAARRQLRTGRNTSTKIVRPWPNRWKNLPPTTGFQLKKCPDSCKWYVQNTESGVCISCHRTQTFLCSSEKWTQAFGCLKVIS